MLPVPAAAIEEAREQGVLSREQYTQLRRISAAMSEGERMADEVETRRARALEQGRGDRKSVV